jgi:hypothetical protein
MAAVTFGAIFDTKEPELLRRKLLSLAAAVATASAFGLAASSARAAVIPTASPVHRASLMGVICDGTTDTTTALQQAIRATETTGGTLLLPEGVCVLSKALQITKGLPITLAGAGIDVTTLVQRSGASGILRIRLDHVTVEDMTLDNHLGGGVEIVSSS